MQSFSNYAMYPIYPKAILLIPHTFNCVKVIKVLSFFVFHGLLLKFFGFRQLNPDFMRKIIISFLNFSKCKKFVSEVEEKKKHNLILKVNHNTTKHTIWTVNLF